ncbi:hypothetical protein D3C80_2044720 [compost metagenome]
MLVKEIVPLPARMPRFIISSSSASSALLLKRLFQSIVQAEAVVLSEADAGAT